MVFHFGGFGMRNVVVVAAVAAGAMVLGGSSAQAGYQTVDLSSYVNASFAGEINGNTFPTGSQTFNGVPVLIANTSNGSGGFNNFWTGGGSQYAAPGLYAVTITLGDVMNVTNVYTMLNTLWGAVGATGVLSITFNAGNGGAAYTQDIVDGVNVRDYNLLFGDSINGTTTKQAFANGLGQVLDMQDYALPSYFATDGLESVTLTENGASGYEKAMFNALTLQTASPAPAGVPEPMTLALLGSGLLALGVARRRAG